MGINLPSDATDTKDAVAQTLQNAAAAYQAGLLQQAEKLYLAILQVQPDHPEANHNLGILALQAKQPEAALNYFTSALNADPACSQYWISYINALLQTAQPEAAREMLAFAQQQGLQGAEVEALALRLNNPLPDKNPEKSVASQAEINVLKSRFNQKRYAEALPLAQQMTLRFPEYVPGWKYLGLIFKQLGRNAEALSAIQQSALLSDDDAEIYNLLGTLYQDSGRLAEAEQSYRHAIQCKPEDAAAHSNLGGVLHDQGLMTEAVACYQRVLQIDPNSIIALYNLGISYNAMGRPDEAMASYRQALRINPKYAFAHNNLGNTLKDLGRLEEAMASYRQALQIMPAYADAHYNLGNTLRNLGRLTEAEPCFRHALQINPSHAAAHFNLGNTLQDSGRLDEACTSYRQVLQLNPQHALAHYNLGVTLHELGRCAEAEISLRLALQLSPDNIDAHCNLANVCKDMGRLDEAAASFRHVLQLKPEYVSAHNNLLFVLNYHPDLSAEQIYREYQHYDACRGMPLRSTWQAHRNDKDPHRRLRIGYVSPDFRNHACRSFLEPLLAHHDKTQVEVYAYAELLAEDAITTRLRRYIDHWIPTSGLSDELLAGRIRSDGIDILIELAGHTAGNRLQVFARKPAPVSLSWLGYGYTTGLSAIDYYLTDEVCVPPGSEYLFSEMPWRIETPASTYRPSDGMGMVGALPALQRGYITFGTLTRSIRINHRTIQAWTEIMQAVPNSRLIIDSNNFKDVSMQAYMATLLMKSGIERERLQIGFHTPPWDVLRSIDIGLDCFPHNSGTTLFESLYMGVPYITLAERPSVGRLGSSILQGIGHSEWIATSAADYVAKAIRLASDTQQLSLIRAALRGQIECSPLRDEVGFARKVEQAYRKMWQIWCDKDDQSIT